LRLDDFRPDPRVPPIVDRLCVAGELIDGTMRTVQKIAAELRPGILDKLGLAMALQYELAQFSERSGIEGKLLLPAEEPVVPPTQATAFFRVFQEALTNVARHARATRVEVEFAVREACRELRISDNGRGLPAADAKRPGALGLLGIEERCRLLGGSVTFSQTPGGGLTMLIRMPNHPPTPTPEKL
jgi:signal transduction histidine kinase